MLLALGILANAFFIIGGFFKKSEISIICSVLGSLTYVFYYLEMQLYAPIATSAVNILVGCVVVFVSSKRITNLSAIIGALLISILILFMYSSAFDILIILAALSIAISKLQKDNYIVFKCFVIISCLLWCWYSLNFNDYAMLVTSTLIIASHSISMIVNMRKDGFMLSKIIVPKFFRPMHNTAPVKIL